MEKDLVLVSVLRMIEKPSSPGNPFPADEVARERIGFDKALIGSCTNGSYDDLLQAALVIHHARRSGVTKTARPFVVFPGSGGGGRPNERPPHPARGGGDRGGLFPGRGGERATPGG